MSTPHESLDRNIEVSEAEHRSHRLTRENVQLGAVLLATRGYVILRGALPLDLVTELRKSFDAILAKDLARHHAGVTQTTRGAEPDGLDSVFWERSSRFRIFPKLVGPFASPYVLRNPFADAILRETLGPNFYCKFVSSDTCVRGSTLQAPHRDIDFYDGRQAFGSLINIPIMHCGMHNGPTEVWPGGSHLWSSETMSRYDLRPFVQDEVNPAAENLVQYLPSKKIELYPGELLIRDPGMWHRGTPNTTDEPRTMLTAGYFRRDYYYEYGDPQFNLDRHAFEQLEPSCQEVFAPFFNRRDSRYWRTKNDRMLRDAAARTVFGHSLRGLVSVGERVKREFRRRRL